MASARPISTRAAIRSRKSNVQKPTKPDFASSRGSYSKPKQHDSRDVPVAMLKPTSRSSKRAKRSSRHDALIAKVQDAGVRKGERTGRRRRRAKNVGTSVAELRDALPEVDEMDADDVWEGLSEEDGNAAHVDALARPTRIEQRKFTGRPREGQMKMRTVKTRPGSMKRRDKMERSERDRFARNLASMFGGRADASIARRASSGTTGQPHRDPVAEASQGERWAALRRFIKSNTSRAAPQASH